MTPIAPTLQHRRAKDAASCATRPRNKDGVQGHPSLLDLYYACVRGRIEIHGGQMLLTVPRYLSVTDDASGLGHLQLRRCRTLLAAGDTCKVVAREEDEDDDEQNTSAAPQARLVTAWTSGLQGSMPAKCHLMAFIFDQTF
ncbi:hypothetical protein CORC01_11663 [Colletotrichum orchidophilum]|uniref:Uncharacterized protein n=1 Tax=Colletotrichum orchidophilum TaxID=1209926 RepID=A0A1G4AV60_9PEZI|nr:uncharacterized protein CORC01_11663 [Colletotrichum orchidophilum]OHE93024.1 hypothetical protein CORC01_11663 [Colletotrichum orchidophilum]